MKAIQIKYKGATDTKPSRLVAMLEGCDANFVEPIESDMDIEKQAYRMCERVILNMHWDNVEISGFGVLPSGDWVATLQDKVKFDCDKCGKDCGREVYNVDGHDFVCVECAEAPTP